MERSACPQDEQLRRLQSGELGPEEAQAVGQHVEDCSRCQSKLDGPLEQLPISGVEKLGRFLRPWQPPPLPEVDGYLVDRELGQGGMGVVYAGRSLQDGKAVALKTLHRELGNSQQARARVFIEFAAWHRLRHEHVVNLVDTGQTRDGRPVLVMEYLAGGNLEQRLRDGLPPEEVAARFVQRLARVVHYAHGQKVVHRDLKPVNILLQEEPGVPLDEATFKVSDFGLAYCFDGQSLHLTQGGLLGTPEYMAPEQIQEAHGAGGPGADSEAEGAARTRRKVGPATDVHALGAILYRMLTGASPFKGAGTAETLHKVLYEEAELPSTRRILKSHSLDLICSKCLEKNPQNRYQSAEELADDLGRYLRGLSPAHLSPPTRLRRLVKEVRRRPVRYALAAATLLALLALAAWANYSRLRQAYNELDAQKRLTEEGHARASHLNRRLDAQLQVMRIGRAREACEAHDLPAALALLHASSAAREDWEWRHVRALCDREGRALAGHAKWVNAVAYCPDGRLLASGGRDGAVRLWGAATGAALKTLDGSDLGAVTGIAFHPDGKRLVSVTGDWDPDAGRFVDGSVSLWDVESGVRLAVLARGREGFHCVAFHPGGRLVATGGKDRTVTLWDVAKGQAVTQWKGSGGEIRSLAFSPDGSCLLTGGADWDEDLKTYVHPEVKLWETASGKVLRDLGRFERGVLGVAYSPDGKRVAATGADMVVVVWDAATGREEHRFLGLRSFGYGLAFSPDGGRVACGSGVYDLDRRKFIEGEVRVWALAERRLERLLRAPGASVQHVAFHPRERQLASAGEDGLVRLWNLEHRRDSLTLRGHMGELGGVAFSPDGRHLVSTGSHKVTLVWDVTTLTILRQLEDQSQDFTSVAYSPRGNLLACGANGGAVLLWDPQAGTLLHTIPAHGECCELLSFSPDGRRLATASDVGPVKIWDTSRATELQRLSGPWDAARPRFAPNGKSVAVGYRDGVTRLWDLESGLVTRELKGHAGRVNDLAFSPDGRTLATGGDDKRVLLWDFGTGEVLHVLEGHNATVHAVSFTPDGRRVVTAGADQTVRLWDPFTGEMTLSLTGHEGTVTGLAISPDGALLATGSQDGTVKLWSAPADRASLTR